MRVRSVALAASLLLAACAAPAGRGGAPTAAGGVGPQPGTGMGSMPGMAAMAGGGHIHLPYLIPELVRKRYRFRVDTEPPTPVAGRETRVKVYVLDAQGGPVTSLQVHHERLVHFLLVSEDLEEFHHVHPEDFGLLTDEARREGRFEFPVTFGSGGRYLVALDFVDRAHAVHAELEVQVDGPAQPGTRWRWSRDRTDDDVAARLVTNPLSPQAGDKVLGRIRLATAEGLPVTDLEPYLGALCHLAIFRERATASAHEHGGGPEFSSVSGAQPIAGYRGPVLYFEHAFERDGRYRIFAQFQRQGTVHTVPFDLEVESPRPGR